MNFQTEEDIMILVGREMWTRREACEIGIQKEVSGWIEIGIGGLKENERKGGTQKLTVRERQKDRTMGRSIIVLMWIMLKMINFWYFVWPLTIFAIRSRNNNEEGVMWEFPEEEDEANSEILVFCCFYYTQTLK
ncbi:unnamed protein product [Brassica oleracea]